MFDALGFLTGDIAQTSFYDKVFSTANITPARTLDAYFRMAGGTGLDGAGKPAFNARSGALGLSDHRIEERDLERCPVVVPDIRQTQIGDLIVRFENSEAGKPLQIGIVVDILTTPAADISAVLSNIVVLSVSRSFEQVTLGTWGNPNDGALFRGFAVDPETFHVRRLVKRKSIAGDNPSADAYVENTWDVLSTAIGSTRLSIPWFYEQTRVGGGRGLRERWIPNTGEYLILDAVRMSACNIAGAAFTLETHFTPSSFEPAFLGAVDRAYTEQPAGVHGNVYRNTESSFERPFEWPLVVEQPLTPGLGCHDQNRKALRNKV